VVVDTTFFTKIFGYCVFRDPLGNRNIFWKETKTETAAVYRDGRRYLERQGFTILAVVTDGKHGIKRVFSDLPVQMCHFHQIGIIKLYLTSRPTDKPSQELWRLAKKLPRLSEKIFTKRLSEWHGKYHHLVDHHKMPISKGRWRYHCLNPRLGSAYRSLKRNLKYLFTFRRHPELKIPNTINSLEGSFSHAKSLLRLHRGLKKKRKRKLIEAILNGRIIL